MQNILRYLPPVIAFGVGVFLVSFLYSLNSKTQVFRVSSQELTTSVVEQKQQDSWLDTFSKTKSSSYSYPANEVFVRYDLDLSMAPKGIYKLFVSLLDPYQIFCLEEEIKHSGLKYYLKKDKNGIELLIYSPSKEDLNTLVKVLKNYDINAQFELNKEDA